MNSRITDLVALRYGATYNPQLVDSEARTLLALSRRGSCEWATLKLLRSWALEQQDDFEGAAGCLAEIFSCNGNSETNNQWALPPFRFGNPLHPVNKPLLTKQLESLQHRMVQYSAGNSEAPSILQTTSQRLLYRVLLRGQGVPRAILPETPVTIPIMLASDMSLFRSMDFEHDPNVNLEIRAFLGQTGPDWSRPVKVDPPAATLDRKGRAVIHASLKLDKSEI
ncbi:hypothetical protein HDU98_011248, partial [Podochytrium sp. JEL0797]